LQAFWISRQDFALATQVNRSLYSVLELPLLLPNPLSHIAMHSGVVPEEDDENELLPERPQRAAKLLHADAHSAVWLSWEGRLALVQPERPDPRTSKPPPRKSLANT
jgi:hypothetical protein